MDIVTQCNELSLTVEEFNEGRAIPGLALPLVEFRGCIFDLTTGQSTTRVRSTLSSLRIILVAQMMPGIQRIPLLALVSRRALIGVLK